MSSSKTFLGQACDATLRDGPMAHLILADMETHGLPWKMVYKWWVFTWFFHAISIGPN
jgi:hypothetical protein